MERPGTIEEAAATIGRLAADGATIRPRGGDTKRGWGGAAAAVDERELDTRGLDRIVEHNRGDFTAVVEAGLRLRDAQAAFADAGQMLALDPPPGAGDAATIGGVVACSDSGPLRHRYGAARDLLVGITVVSSDGVVASSGGRVIKNVAGYDLAKLFTGSYGTLGLIASVAVRLHPVAATTATATGRSGDPAVLAAAAAGLAALPLEADCLDVAWSDGAGSVLVRFSGATAERQAEAAAQRLAAAGLEETGSHGDDDATWAAQRARQRAPDGGAALRVSALPTDLPSLIRAAERHGAELTARAGLGLTWLVLAPGADLAARVLDLRAAVAPRAATLLDGAAALAEVPAWPDVDAGALAVMRRVKERFDPARAFRPGAFVGGI